MATAAPAPEGTEQNPMVVRIDWRNHVPIVVAGVTFLFIIVEAYGVGDFDIPTALTLLEEAGATHILLGTLLGFLPYLLPVLLFAAIATAVRLRRRGATWESQAAAWAFVLVAGMLSAWRFALLMAVVVGAYAAIVAALVRAADRRRDSEGKGDLPHEGSTLGPAVLVALAGFFIISLTTPWVPEERLRFEETAAERFRPGDGFERVARGVEGTGYVIHASEGFITLLTEENRRTIQVPAEELAAREVCRGDVAVPRESIAQLLFARTQHSQTPACPN